LEVGRSQANIYCWLTGLPKYAVVLYNVYNEKLEKYYFNYDKRMAERDIEKGIEIKMYLLEGVEKVEMREDWRNGKKNNNKFY